MALDCAVDVGRLAAAASPLCRLKRICGAGVDGQRSPHIEETDGDGLAARENPVRCSIVQPTMQAERASDIDKRPAQRPDGRQRVDSLGFSEQYWASIGARKLPEQGVNLECNEASTWK